MSTTWEKLVEANKMLSTLDIKGKAYVLVNERVKAFRSVYPNGTITTDIINMEGGTVTMMAKVYDGEKLIATGYAQEKETSSYINKTSYIENCETSAIGRALGFCGFGIDVSIASAEEVTNAINQQEEMKKIEAEAVTDQERNIMLMLMEKHNMPTDKVPEKVTKKDYDKMMRALQKKENNG